MSKQYTRSVDVFESVECPTKNRIGRREPLPELPTATRITLYFITQEALNNVIKHAKATDIEIILEPQADRVVLAIKDNGQGFAPDQISKGMGLGNMRDRALEIGADFNVESLLTGGTQILAYITDHTELSLV